MTRDEVARRRVAGSAAERMRRIGYSEKHRAKKALAANPGDPSVSLLRPRHAGEVEARVALVRAAKAAKVAAKMYPFLTDEELEALLP